MTIDVLGIPFHPLTPEQAVSRTIELLDTPGNHRIVTPNPEILWKCHKDPALRAIIAGADLILADGIGVVKAAKTLGRPLPGRVMGVEWAQNLLPELEKRGKRLFLLGAKPGVAQQAAENLAKQHPALTVCGVHDGYFTDDEAVCAEITSAKADVVFVCLGSPRQERWMAANAHRLDGVLTAGLGGTLDVFAGTVKRAPKLWSHLGLEWLYRVLRQPSRLPRLLAIPQFLLAVRAQRHREKRGKP